MKNLSKSSKLFLLAFLLGGAAGTAMAAENLLREFFPTWQEEAKALVVVAAVAAVLAMVAGLAAVIYLTKEWRGAIETGNRLEDEAAKEAEEKGEYIP